MSDIVKELEALRCTKTNCRPIAHEVHEETLDKAIAIVQRHKAKVVELMEALKALAPFEVTQGDMIHRLQPNSRQVVNTNAAWAVSNGDLRSAHRVRAHVETINRALSERGVITSKGEI